MKRVYVVQEIQELNNFQHAFKTLKVAKNYLKKRLIELRRVHVQFRKVHSYLYESSDWTHTLHLMPLDVLKSVKETEKYKERD